METEQIIPQPETTTDENAPSLRPWSAPRLQRLNSAVDTEGGFIPVGLESAPYAVS